MHGPEPGNPEPSRVARAYLLRVAEPPAPALVDFVAEVGPVRAADLVREGRVPGPVADETSARRHLDLGRADLDEAAAVGARLVTPEDEEWPSWPFTALSVAAARGLRGGVPPLALWVRGAGGLGEMAERAVAVVGSRAASGYGQHVATEFGHGLASAGVTVVSGAAYGVDGAAHRGAVAAEGPTVAVLACGVDIAYPAGHSTLLGRIAEHGAVVSEYPPGTTPARYRFLVRNRLIAALGGGTVVVEAGARSGARSTAAVSRALGRVLMAVPGPITSATSVGCHELLRSGEAVAVSTVEEIIESTGRLGADLVDLGAAETRATDGLDGDAARVYDALSTRSGRSPERIAVEAGVPLPRVRALLPTLELGGLAVRCTTGWRRARAPTPSRER
ncbi:DNA-processing protein DprA [Gandjariella thermophila]|uniref:DNA processing protein DprA n=1 Tax=Gandjariella thermophila TaxID=1931992 RepID=A0A4D4J9J1_9PSEU|nr:DNA-processing protein DprA [Gandjariella thermophila]GDY30607.1 DNA processing protein DprA [Gandjariella thermophila]